jgi:hypothetical protein
MLDTFGFPTPQGSNYQEFYGGGSTRDWIKPRGASMVRMLLIGGGAGGRGGSPSTAGDAGGSGAITKWIGPAIFIPDQLRISIGAGGASDAAGGNTLVIWQGPTSTTGYTLLTANGAASGIAGVASANNFFGASGIYSSIAGQAGASVSSSITASTTTFLSGGAGGGNATTTAGGNVNCNYGYPTISGGAGTTGGNGKDGYFLTQPIMFGVGGSGGGGRSSAGANGNGGNGGIGCGGGGGGICSGGTSLGGRGGNGAVFIWSW